MVSEIWPTLPKIINNSGRTELEIRYEPEIVSSRSSLVCPRRRRRRDGCWCTRTHAASESSLAHFLWGPIFCPITQKDSRRSRKNTLCIVPFPGFTIAPVQPTLLTTELGTTRTRSSVSLGRAVHIGQLPVTVAFDEEPTVQDRTPNNCTSCLNTYKYYIKGTSMSRLSCTYRYHNNVCVSHAISK